MQLNAELLTTGKFKTKSSALTVMQWSAVTHAPRRCYAYVFV